MKKTTKLWYFTAFLIVINVIMYLAKWGGEKVLLYVSDTLPIICSLVSAICLWIAFRGFKNFDFAKKAWLLIFIGILLDFFAESTYAILEIVFVVDMNETFPTLADFFWCAGYIPLFWGLFLMFYGYKKSGFPLGNTKLYIFLAILLFLLLSTVFYFVLLPIFRDTETRGITKLFYIFYPAADVLVVIPVAILMYITSLFGMGKISWPWRFLALGFISFTGADLLYSYLSWEDIYGSGNLIDLAWHLGYLLIGMSGLYQRELIESVNGRA